MMNGLEQSRPEWVVRLQEMNPFGGEFGSWLLAGTVFLTVVLGLAVLRRLLLSRLQGVVERSKNTIDDLLLDLVRRTKWPFFLALGLFLGIMFLDLEPNVSRIVRRLFSLALFIQVGAWADHVLQFWLDSHLQRSRETDPSKAAVLSLFSFFGRVAVWSLVILLALDNIGVNITALIAGLGIGGIAIGLALQSVFKDMFASLAIILDKPFEIGDFVIVDDLAGDVEHIGIKTTRIRSLSGEELVLSNDDLLSSRIRNYKLLQERRVMIHIGLAYENTSADLERVQGIVESIVEANEFTRFDRAYFKDYGEYALEYEIAYYLTVPDFARMMAERQAINIAIHREFEAQGIRFAYPTRRVILGDGPEASS